MTIDWIRESDAYFAYGARSALNPARFFCHSIVSWVESSTVIAGIPIEARIVSLADYFDALATKRPYKEPFSKEVAVDYVRRMSGKKFDPRVVNAFLKVVDGHYREYIEKLNAS